MGRHGLLIGDGGRRGVLLPQVPGEHGWDRETFLVHTCRKAGLPDDAWRRAGVELLAFTADVFGEEPDYSCDAGASTSGPSDLGVVSDRRRLQIGLHCGRSRGLANDPCSDAAARHLDHLAGDEVGGGRGEEQDGAHHVRRAAGMPDGHAVAQHRVRRGRRPAPALVLRGGRGTPR